MSSAPVIVQRRFMELGRVRLGEKGARGEPRKLDTFRFTSASRVLLEAVAAKYGGTVQEWQGAPDEGYYELKTDSTALDIILPPTFSTNDGEPTLPWSQFFELWSGGGCQRRCDGQTEALSGKPCMCNPEERACDITTRISFILPDIPGLGVWRLDSKGWNAAAELPGTLQLLHLAAAERKFIPAVLRMEQRSSKKEGQTRRFVVPVIDLPQVTVNELAGGDLLSLNAPTPPPPRPALPVGPEPPADPSFDSNDDFGQRPPLPSEAAAAQAVGAQAPVPQQEPSPQEGDADGASPSASSAASPVAGATAAEPPTEQSPFVPPVTLAMSPTEFKEAREREGITQEAARAKLLELWPDKSPRDLTNEQRAELWKALVETQQVLA